MEPEKSQKAVSDNKTLHRFELTEEGLVAFADYVRRGDVLVIPHVETPLALRGKGAAGRLMQGLLEMVREAGLKVDPTCPYAAAFIKRRRDYQDLLA